METPKVAVAFVCDNDYVMPTSVAITSLIENKLPSTFYRVYVLGDRLTEENCHLLEELSTPRVEIVVIPVKEDLEQYKCVNTGVYLVATKAALLKFNLPEILSEEEKVIFLDGDVIVRKDLSKLFNIDLGGGKYAAVVRDLPQVLFDKQLIDTGSGRDYFNSGVMLLNLVELRKNDISKKLYETKLSMLEDTLMDQNVFNVVFQDKVVQLPVEYNVLYVNLAESWEKYNILQRINETYKSNYMSLDDILQRGVIVHYSSPNKPWLFFDAPLADDWLYYYMKSPYRDVPLYRSTVIKNKPSKFQNFATLTQPQTEDIIPIVFATNKNYVSYLLVAIQSIIEHANSSKHYKIFVFHSDLCSSDIQLIENVSNSIVEVYCVDIGKISQSVNKNFYVRAHYSKEMYYRWFIPEVLPQYEKVLYLDCDLVTLRDVSELYESELNDNIIGGVTNTCDPFTQYRVIKHFSVPATHYINSGVLLFNNKQFILNKVKLKCMQLACTLTESLLICPDQDIINLSCKDKIELLDDKWNFQWHHLWDLPEKRLEPFAEKFESARSNIGIIHFTAGIKPWDQPTRPLASYFWKYARLSPVYEELLCNYLSKKLKTESNKNKSVAPVTPAAPKKIQQTPASKNVVDSNSNKKGVGQTNPQQKKIVSNSQSEKRLQEIINSRSYKIGRMVTFVPRKLLITIKCYKDHGLAFTVDRILVNLHLKKDKK